MGESETELIVVGEDSGTETLQLAQAGSSITVNDENGQIGMQVDGTKGRQSLAVRAAERGIANSF